MSNNITLNRIVSAIRFVRSDENHSKFIRLDSVSITSNQTMNLYTGDISNKRTWSGVVNPTDRYGQVWNYVFPDSINFVVSFYAENGHKEFTLTKSGVVIAPNKKYTVIISRNNTDNAKDVKYTININTDWEGEEVLI